MYDGPRPTEQGRKGARERGREGGREGGSKGEREGGMRGWIHGMYEWKETWMHGLPSLPNWMSQ